MARLPLTLALLLAGAAAAAAAGGTCPDDQMGGGGSSGFNVVCGGYNVPDCTTVQGHAGGKYGWVVLQDVLRDIGGQDGQLFFKKPGSCTVHSVSILRLCVKKHALGRSDYRIKVLLTSNACGKMRVKARCFKKKHGRWDCSLNGRTAT